ncbi:MAG: response regulator transcription factor [Acidobacteria bacterium]|nr:response regulator transcription factor [Acidobacteriota bacterium]
MPNGVFVCDAQPIVIEGVEKVLGACEDLRLVGSAATVNDAVRALPELRPELVVLGYATQSRALLPQITQVRECSPASRVVLWILELSELECFRALQLGARGILRKTQPVSSVLECLRAVAAGNVWIENSVSNEVLGFMNRASMPRITPREREIVEYVCRGLKNKEIAEALSITPGTVKVHLMHIFEKTGVKDRFQLALQGRQLLGIDDYGVNSHVVSG